MAWGPGASWGSPTIAPCWAEDRAGTDGALGKPQARGGVATASLAPGGNHLATHNLHAAPEPVSQEANGMTRFTRQ